MQIVVHSLADASTYLVVRAGKKVGLAKLFVDEAGYQKKNRNLDARVLNGRVVVRNTVDRVVILDQPIDGDDLITLVENFVKIFEQAKLDITFEEGLIDDLVRIYLVVWPN